MDIVKKLLFILQMKDVWIMKKETYDILTSKPVDQLIDDGVDIGKVLSWTFVGIGCLIFWIVAFIVFI